MTGDSRIVLYQPDETLTLEVRLERETVWLTQAQMTELFHTTRNNVTIHIGNIFKEGELDESSVCKDSLRTASDGKKYRTKYYNLDVIISVGYRIKNPIGTRFRQWANTVIKQYLLQGYSVNRHLIALQENMEKRMTRIEDAQVKQQQQLDFFIRTSTPPAEMCSSRVTSTLPAWHWRTSSARPQAGHHQRRLCVRPHARHSQCPRRRCRGDHLHLGCRTGHAEADGRARSPLPELPCRRAQVAQDFARPLAYHR